MKDGGFLTENIKRKVSRRETSTIYQNFTYCIRLLSHCLLSVSGCFCESKTVEVQSGETVTLLCSDFTASRVQTDWFRVVNGTEVSCISSIFSSDGDPSFCDGFDGVKFEMNSNSSSVSLKISGVDESDSGLYFCGFYRNRHTVIGDVTQLIIKDSTFCVKHPYTSLLTVILAVLMGFSIFGALGLVVIFKHHCAGTFSKKF
uniref:Ig-like domain-containing protein n=1 Tax=Oryzias latipes TaxID=8090 RepID=A0A3B3IP51_ORYLA